MRLRISLNTFLALTLAFLGPIFAAPLAGADEQTPTQVSVEFTVDEQVTQASITLTTLDEQLVVTTEQLAEVDSLVTELIDSGLTTTATIDEVVNAAVEAVDAASLALEAASDSLFDTEAKQDSYTLAVAASDLADATLEQATTNYDQAVIDLSSISSAVAAQEQVVQDETNTLNQLKDVPADGWEFTSPNYVAPTESSSVSATPEPSTATTLPPMWDASTKIDVPFDIKMGDTLYEGQGADSQIYVTSKAFISFGQPDYTFWDWPQTTGIYVYQSDWMTAGDGAYTTITTTDNTLTVEWSLHRFGDSQGPLTNVIWNMTVDTATGEWTGYSEISGNTEGLYGGPRIGVRYENNGELYTMSPVITDTASAEAIAIQEDIVATETATLVDLQTAEELQTVVVDDKFEVLALAASASEEASTAELAALDDFVASLETTNMLVDTATVLVQDAQTKTETAYYVVSVDSSSLYYNQARDSMDAIQIVYGFNVEDYSQDPRVEAYYNNQTTYLAAAINDDWSTAFIAANNMNYAIRGIQDAWATNTLIPDPIVVVEQPVPSPTPQSTPSTTPEASVGPSPSISPQDSQTTPTPEPTATEQPSPSTTPTPSPSATSEPVQTEPTLPLPTESSSPTPEPTPEPLPSSSDTPTPAPSSSVVPEPTPTVPAQPSPTPTPVATPTATSTPSPLPTETSTATPTPTPTTIQTTPSPTPSATPSPTPTEEPVVELKEELSADNIVAAVAELVNIEDPRDLSTAQVEAVKEAAYEVFDSGAEQGSPEYEAALEALAVAAAADDPELPAELAAIPLLGDAAGAVLEVFNDLGNVGADMSPQVRAQSEKVVVAAVIVGQIALTASMATSLAIKP